MRHWHRGGKRGCPRPIWHQSRQGGLAGAGLLAGAPPRRRQSRGWDSDGSLFAVPQSRGCRFPGICPSRAVWLSKYSNPASGKERLCHVLKPPGLSFPLAGGHLCGKRRFFCEFVPKCRDKLCVKASCLEILKYRLLLGCCPDLWSTWRFPFINA